MTNRVVFSLFMLVIAAVAGCGGGPSVPNDPRAEASDEQTLLASSVRGSTLSLVDTVRGMLKSPGEASSLGEFCNEQTAGFERILDDARTDDPHRPTYEELLSAWQKVAGTVGSPQLEEALNELQAVATDLPEQ